MEQEVLTRSKREGGMLVNFDLMRCMDLVLDTMQMACIFEEVLQTTPSMGMGVWYLIIH